MLFRRKTEGEQLLSGTIRRLHLRAIVLLSLVGAVRRRLGLFHSYQRLSHPSKINCCHTGRSGRRKLAFAGLLQGSGELCGRSQYRIRAHRAHTYLVGGSKAPQNLECAHRGQPEVLRQGARM